MEIEIPTSPGCDSDAKVASFVEMIIRNAERDADRVAAFLKVEGFQPTAPTKSVSFVDTANEPAARILLHLAAALRLRSWERAGIIAFLPGGLPSAAETLATTPDAGAEKSLAIPRRVFRTELANFSLHGEMILGVDVLLNAQNCEALLEPFAELLLSISQ